MRTTAASEANRALMADKHAVITEDVLFLLDTGTPTWLIAVRLDTTVANLARRFYRRGQPDIARRFDHHESIT